MSYHQQLGQKTNLDEAAQRELRRLESLDAQTRLVALREMAPTLFEHLTAALFEQQEYTARTVGASGDEGVDVLLRKGKLTSVVQCKRYRDTVGQSTIRDLYGTMIHNQAAEAFLVTTGNISRNARDWAQGKPIRLIDGETLSEWIANSASERSLRKNRKALPAWTSSRWLWPVAALLLIFFGVAVGLAFTVLTDRISTSDALEATVGTPTVQVNNELDGQVTDANERVELSAEDDQEPNQPASDEGTKTAIAESVLQATVIPEVTPTITPMPICQTAVLPEFAAHYQQEALGCPTSDRFITWAAWQPFQRGYLFWRSDEDTSYALIGTQNGRWRRLSLEGSRELVNRGDPPSGYQAPVRGFGYLWSSDDRLFQNIGWATDKEKGFCVVMQGYEQGLILQSTPVDSCTPSGLYNQAQAADWTPINIVSHVDGRWSVDATLPSAASQAPSSTQQATQGRDGTATSATTAADGRSSASGENEASRPSSHGLFAAGAASELSLDGNLDDWNEHRWMPISSVVWGNEKRSDDADLSSQFKLAWSSTGLWIAIRVADERYNPGPFGTNMWQGDGLELHFDQNLAGDFDTSTMTNDDFQIGISFGPNLNQITAYRWIPFDREGAIPIRGAAKKTAQGYDAEFNLLWSTFGLTNLDAQPGARFGFNLSVNDNDSATPAQETTISASPARTDHKTPTEWGTLILE